MPACATCGHALTPGARFCANCGSPVEDVPRSREVRKTVTVLFADVTGSTALGEQLDPESLRALMTRYFAEMQAIIERHGGTVEKFIGDAVMAVFGIPAVHEDDALRAVRAAVEIRDRLAELNAELTATRGLAIRFRTGVYTGEVVAGDPASGQTLVTGDTVNTAARLEQAAPPGEILIGRPTYGLVRDAVEAEPVEAIAAKGKAEPVPAYRLVSVTPGLEGHVRRFDRALVGRDAELAALLRAFEAAVAERAPQLVTVLGTAGVGKSRLTAELVASIEGRATVLKGRCLPYGEGITYWPIRELIHEAAAITEADTADEAQGKVRALLEGEPEAELLAARIASAVGLSTEAAPQEELFWAIRRLLEHLARQRPLVVLVEDIHWAEPTLLDLLEYVVDLAADAPLLVACPARPELLESRPGWGARRSSSIVLRLEALGAASATELLASLPGGSALPLGLRDRILEAAEGNPLYLEEIVGMLVDDGRLVETDRTWTAAADLDELPIPHSVKALLAARIDGLPEPERRVAERASVVGRVFEAAAVRELAGDGGGAEVGRSLLALVRKELVRPERAELVAGDAFKFRHLLIRDAAYDALPKVERADLHERFASWLERAAGERIAEYDEILGYHYEQAHHYLTELGESGELVERLADRASERLAAAARRGRDLGAVAGLLGRAAAVLPPRSHSRTELLIELAEEQVRQGTFDAAASVLDDAEREIDVLDQRLAAHLALARLAVDLFRPRPANPLDQTLISARQIARSLDELGDDSGLARAWRLIMNIEALQGHLAEASDAARRVAVHATRSGEPVIASRTAAISAYVLVLGPTPVPDAIAECEALIASLDHDRRTRANVEAALAVLRAMGRSFEPARALYRASRAMLTELGAGVDALTASLDSAQVEILAGDLATAESQLRRDEAALAELNEASYRSTVLARLGEVLARLGKFDEAIECTVLSERLGDPSDLETQARWRTARALALLAGDDIAEASRCVDEALQLTTATSNLNLRADVLADATIVLETAGHHAEALASLADALALYDQKENLAAAANLRGRVSPLLWEELQSEA